MWKWPDGSTYAGQAKHGNREGKGLYVTKMRVSVSSIVSLIHECDSSEPDDEECRICSSMRAHHSPFFRRADNYRRLSVL